MIKDKKVEELYSNKEKSYKKEFKKALTEFIKNYDGNLDKDNKEQKREPLKYYTDKVKRDLLNYLEDESFIKACLEELFKFRIDLNINYPVRTKRNLKLLKNFAVIVKDKLEKELKKK